MNTELKQLENKIDGSQDVSDKTDLWKFKSEKILKIKNVHLNKSEIKPDSVNSENVSRLLNYLSYHYLTLEVILQNG